MNAVRRLRLPLIRVLRSLLRLRSRSLSLPSGPLLVVAPHPDDETLGCAGLILRHRLSGHSVRCLFLTDGSASHPGHPCLTPDLLAARRRSEAAQASAILGLSPDDLSFLSLPDGRLDELSSIQLKQALNALAHELRQFPPAAILLPHHADGSSEHHAAHKLLSLAIGDFAPRPRCLEYMVWAAYSPRLLLQLALRPANIWRLDFPGEGPKKKRAITAYSSQFEPCPPWTSPVLAADFASAFSFETEYFFETAQ